MSQAYLYEADEDSPTKLPSLEIFWADDLESEYGNKLDPGWYYWACFPGGLPDSDPFGPFDSEDGALEDARSMIDDE